MVYRNRLGGKLLRVTGMETAAVRVLPGLIRPAVWLYRRWRPEKHSRALAQRADDLASAVGRAEDKLQQELRAKPGSFMPVTFTAADHAQPGEVIDSAEVDDISHYFDLLDQPRRMVVLGDPGAGKTVAATYLVGGLIQRRRELDPESRRAAEPVPVRLNTAGWDGGQEFSTWLVSRLKLDHQLPSILGAEMVRAGMILPLLDGLDEMDDETTDGKRARALLDRLNEREWAHRPVVVLCRSIEFDHLEQAGSDNGLHGAVTVTLAPLSSGQPADYLTSYQHRIGATHPAWDKINTHLREHADPERADSPLAVTLRNPWMLGLTAHTLHRDPTTAAALLDCPTPEAVRDRLFAAQIPAAIAGTDDTERFRDYTPDNVEKWLRTLARHLEHRRDTGRNGTAIRLDEIWEIAGTAHIRLLHALAITLTTGLALGLPAGAAFGITFGLKAGAAFGITFGLISEAQRTPAADSIAWKVPTRSRWRGGFVMGFKAGIPIGVTVGLMLGVTVGLMLGLASGLIFGFVGGLSTTAEDRLAMGIDERRLILNDLQSALFHGAAFGLAIGFALGFALGPAVGLAVGFAVGLAGGSGFGLASGRFFLAVLAFKFTADFPDRPAAFLDWARNSGLLRVNATAYQFRHQTYQQWILHPRQDSPDTASLNQ